jgi:hypothetical protein
MDGPAPAIVNAVEDALGVRFDSIPLLPEDIMDGLNAGGLNMDGLNNGGLEASSPQNDASPRAGADD